MLNYIKGEKPYFLHLYVLKCEKYIFGTVQEILHSILS